MEETNPANAQGIRAILHTECHSAFQYVERLLKALQHESSFKHKLLHWREQTAIELFDHLRVHCLNEAMALDQYDNHPEFEKIQQLILAFSAIPFALRPSIDCFTTILECLYSRAQQLQQWADELGNHAILQPRMAQLKACNSKEEWWDGRAVGRELDRNPDFLYGSLRYCLLSEDLLLMLERPSPNEHTITPLEEQRQRKYRQFIDEGMQLMQQKMAIEALDKFKKAAQFKITAEAFNLMAWSWSQQGNMDKAKEFCLKAIQVDGNYGPAFNDYGVYLMNEGRNQEALSWFAQAKVAPVYENREFPFINCGRIYLQDQQYSLALREFSEAMRMAPQHRQLKEMVSKLARALVKQAQRDVPPDMQSHEGPRGPWPVP